MLFLLNTEMFTNFSFADFFKKRVMYLFERERVRSLGRDMGKGRERLQAHSALSAELDPRPDAGLISRPSDGLDLTTLRSRLRA